MSLFDDERWEKEERLAKKMFKWAWIAWAVAVLLGLTFWGGVIYIAIHFIKKFW